MSGSVSTTTTVWRQHWARNDRPHRHIARNLAPILVLSPRAYGKCRCSVRAARRGRCGGGPQSAAVLHRPRDADGLPALCSPPAPDWLRGDRECEQDADHGAGERGRDALESRRGAGGGQSAGGAALRALGRLLAQPAPAASPGGLPAPAPPPGRRAAAPAAGRLTPQWWGGPGARSPTDDCAPPQIPLHERLHVCLVPITRRDSKRFGLEPLAW